MASTNKRILVFSDLKDPLFCCYETIKPQCVFQIASFGLVIPPDFVSIIDHYQIGTFVLAMYYDFTGKNDILPFNPWLSEQISDLGIREQLFNVTREFAVNFPKINLMSALWGQPGFFPQYISISGKIPVYVLEHEWIKAWNTGFQCDRIPKVSTNLPVIKLFHNKAECLDPVEVKSLVLTTSPVRSAILSPYQPVKILYCPVGYPDWWIPQLDYLITCCEKEKVTVIVQDQGELDLLGSELKQCSTFMAWAKKHPSAIDKLITDS